MASDPATREPDVVTPAPTAAPGPSGDALLGEPGRPAFVPLPRRERPLAPQISGRRLVHENSVLLTSLAGGMFALVVALVMLFRGDYTSRTQWTLCIFMVGSWLASAFAVRSLVIRPLQTLSNMHAALREGDYSMRARAVGRDDALGELMHEINALTGTLREQKLGAMEASALLGKVMQEIEVGVFAFDDRQVLRLINRTGEKLLAQPVDRLLGKTATDLNLSETLEGPAAQTLELRFAGGTGRYGVRRTLFRQGGYPHQLLVLTDMSRALRDEERQAWQRLVRVLGHELNNSLAPVRSIAESLEMLVRRDPRPADWEDDLKRGLRVINERAEALSRFMRDYARLARLPQPKLNPVDLAALLRRVAGLETRISVGVVAGPEVTVAADADQLEQLFINLIRNAVDAATETRGGVSVSWWKNASYVHVAVTDEGPGISNPTNLFVPFFTTKPGGSGIGLALSRQIAEGHGGHLSLHNRTDRSGVEARLQLPVKHAVASQPSTKA